MRNLPRRLLVCGLFVSVSISAAAAEAPDGQRWWSHVRFLADDRLEGRKTGSEGHRKAAAYVADEFARAGLKPAGSDGYLQAVDLRSREIDEGQCSLSLVRTMGTDSLTLGEDAIISVRVDPAPEVDVELVFVGY